MIKIHNKDPGILEIMLTAQAHPDVLNNTRKNGEVLDFTAKPWNKNKLMNKVSRLLEG